jgi:hypothetical protein
LHTLRHSVAVGWFESGVHIKAVADLLGHSSIRVTGDIYGHTTDTAARRGAGPVTDSRCATYPRLVSVLVSITARGIALTGVFFGSG